MCSSQQYFKLLPGAAAPDSRFCDEAGTSVLLVKCRLFAQNGTVPLPAVQLHQRGPWPRAVLWLHEGGISLPCVRALPSSTQQFPNVVRTVKTGTADFRSRPLYSFSNCYFYLSFKISDQPSPSSPLGSHVSHTTTAPPGATTPPAATTCLFRAPKSAQLYSATGSGWAQPLLWSKSSMAIVTLYVAALKLVWLDGPAAGSAAPVLLWDVTHVSNALFTVSYHTSSRSSPTAHCFVRMLNVHFTAVRRNRCSA